MTVYVDDARISFKARGRSMLMCHMLADTQEELHEMAESIGLRPEWFQEGRFNHYDVSLSKRTAAVRLGAREVTAREMVKRFRPS